MVSIIYMFILLAFLLIKNKTKGMQIMAVAFGLILIIQYIAVLFNLTSSTSPKIFPPEFNPYPNSTYPQGYYTIPLYLKSDFLRDHLVWTHFFGFDLQRDTLNKIWFDFINLALITIYFFRYGNPVNSHSIKVSFSSTRSMEYSLNEYAKILIKKKAIAKTEKDFGEPSEEVSNAIR
jgi:hypothetical protein